MTSTVSFTPSPLSTLSIVFLTNFSYNTIRYGTVQ